MAIDVKTVLKPQSYDTTNAINQSVTHRKGRQSITAGLSNEAKGYVEQAVKRYNKDEFSIFNDQGLMPETLEELNSRVSEQCKTDWRKPLNYTTNENGSITVFYDSDGDLSYDRTATYVSANKYSEYEYDLNSLGEGLFRTEDDVSKTIKIEETFDVDENGINELKLAKRPILSNRLCEEDKGWWIFKTKELKLKSYEYRTEYRIQVNRDNIGFDKKNGYHWEYEENSMVGFNNEKDVQTTITRTEWYDVDSPSKTSNETKFYYQGEEVIFDF